MKKTVSILLVSVMTLVLFASCGGGALKDGTYRAEASDARAESDGNGWRDVLEINVVDGVASIVEFEGYNVEDGRPKSAETEETYPMTIEEFGTHPSLFYAEYITKWSDVKGVAKDIDIIAGATGSGNTLKELTDLVMKAAAKGDTTTQILE